MLPFTVELGLNGWTWTYFCPLVYGMAATNPTLVSALHPGASMRHVSMSFHPADFNSVHYGQVLCMRPNYKGVHKQEGARNSYFNIQKTVAISIKPNSWWGQQ